MSSTSSPGRLHRHARLRWRGGLAGLFLMAFAPHFLGAQEATVPQEREPVYPVWETTREVALTSVGGAALFTGLLIPIDVRNVPASGFDPATINFSMDRRIIGNADLDAANASDWTRNAAFLMPLTLAAFIGPDGQRRPDLGRRTLIYGEAFLLSMGLTALGKSAFSRPRPFTYLSDDERPVDDYYDPTAKRAFVSMPSGHASSAWTAVGLGAAEFMLYEPAASGWARGAVGFVGGALAGSTAALRVHAGQHFPSDVIVGSLLGLGSGVAVPILHRGDIAMPTTRAWLETSGGMVAGALAGILLSDVLY